MPITACMCCGDEQIVGVCCGLQKSLEDAQGLVVSAQWPGWTCHSLWWSECILTCICPALPDKLARAADMRSTHLHEPTCERCAPPAHFGVSMSDLLQSLRCGFNTRWELLAMQGRIW